MFQIGTVAGVYRSAVPKWERPTLNHAACSLRTPFQMKTLGLMSVNEC